MVWNRAPTARAELVLSIDDNESFHRIRSRRLSPAARRSRHDAAEPGEAKRSKAAFERAADLATTDADRRFLAQQIRELTEGMPT
jgi:predicted RNA polymerase sigma factor